MEGPLKSRGDSSSLQRLKAPAIVVVGGACTDFVAYGPRLPGAHAEVTGEQFCQLPGGKGANQALAVARLGRRAALITRVGSDQRGDAVLRHLSREGVDIHRCLRDADAPTGAIVLMVDHDGTKQTMTVPGATGRLRPHDIEQSEDLMEQAQFLLIQFEAPGSTVLYAIAAAHRKGMRVILDAGQAVSFPEERWKQIYLVRANAKEAAALSGIRVTDAKTARQACRYLMDRGVQAAAIEAGGEGNLLMWPEGDVLLPLIPVKQVDRTGSGDAFVAALAVAVLEGHPWIEAGWFANAAAALTTTKLGAGPGIPRRQEVLSLLSRIGRGPGLEISGQPKIRKEPRTMTQRQIRRETGITHYPFEQEQDSQEQVPPPPNADEEAVSSAAEGSMRGHRLSRQEGNQAKGSFHNSLEGKGGKGGKTGGSRAGLLGSRKVPKGRR